MKVRQDAWSHEDDLLLAETVLRHIREGSTQLNAFDEVGDHLNRTSAACGFRWNAEVRQKYISAMAIAKKQRKERKRALAYHAQQLSQEYEARMETDSKIITNSPRKAQFQEVVMTDASRTNVQMTGEINLDSVLTYLKSIRTIGTGSQILRSENERLARENKTLANEKEKLEKRLQRLHLQNSSIQDDYQALVKIMDRARRFVSVNDEDVSNPTDLNHDDFGQMAK